MNRETQRHQIPVLGQATTRQFSVNVALTLGTRLLMLASSLATSIVIARWLGAQGVGSLAVLNVTVALAVQVGAAGLPSANTLFVSQDRSKVGAVWANALLFSFLAGILLATALILLARAYSGLLWRLPVSLVSVAAFSIPFQLVNLLGNNVFLAIGRVRRFNQIDAATQLILLFNAVTTLILLSLGLASLVFFNTVTSALLSVVVIVLIAYALKQVNGGTLRPDGELFKRIMRYAIKFHVVNLVPLIILRADVLIVNHFRGEREAGVYAVASQMSNLMMLLPVIISTLLFPRVASQPDPRGGMTMRVTRHTAFIMLFACIAAIPLSFALPFVYGSEFRDSTNQLLILLPGIYLLGIESVMVQHFNSIGLPLAIPLFWIMALICNLVANLLLIPSLGALGAALTSTFTYSLIFLLVAIYFRSRTGNPLALALLLRGDEFRELLSPIRLVFFSR